MQIGEAPSSITNRGYVPPAQKYMELIEQIDGQYDNSNANDSLVPQTNPQVFKAETCYTKLFGHSNSTPEKSQENRIPNYQKQEFDEYEEAWFEKHYKIKMPEQQIGETNNNNAIVHYITPDDTLEGLELQYGVPAPQIRNYNHLQSNDIYYLKSIEIPNPQCDFQKQEKTDWPAYLKEVKINEFVNKICYPEDKNRKVAHFYLDSSDWNMLLAIKDYQADYEFEQQNKKAKLPQQSKIPRNKVMF